MAAEQNTVSTSLSALRGPADASQNVANVRAGFDSHQGFELMQRGAKLLAASTLVPTNYQGNIPNCVIALNMASRLGADPLLVMQNLYVVHGRPAWSAQFLIATFNQCGRFSAIRYRWTGTEGKDDWSCQAYAAEKDTGEIISGPTISIALAKKEGWYQKSGSKWQSIPQLMLMYRAAAWLVRTHAPEISMGLQTAEEVHDVFDAKRGASGEFEVDLDSLRQPAGEAATTPASVAEDLTPAPAPAIPHYTIETAIAKLRAAATTDAVDAAWKEIAADFSGREFPVDIEVARNDRRSALEEASRKAGK